MSIARRTGLVGALLATAAAGAAGGLALERRAVGRTRQGPDPDAAETWGELPADRVHEVLADDGVPLHVEEVGPADAPLTVVLAHGYTQELAVWHFQRKAFAADPAGARYVFYDQRSHGRSGRSPHEHATIDQLGRDLSRILEVTAPEGPVVLVGHSMGGMTIMALADQQPALFGSRVVGVALVATSTGKLADVTFGLPAALTPVSRRVLPFLTRGMRTRPSAFERGRALGTDLGYLVAKRMAFGTTQVSPSLVAFVEKMTADCPVDVIAEFYDTFLTHDKLEAIQVLRGVDVEIVIGTLDRLTPVEHSRAMAEFLPDAELVVVEGAGHMVQLERPALVTARLSELVARAARRRLTSA